jgi:GT2 family glycosyltransferase
MIISGCAPIALFVYNRPDHARLTVEALKKNALAQASDLFIFSDAPKKPEAAETVREVREYIKTISGFGAVSIVERDKNWGLADSIIDGVSRLCKEYGRVIVLEDDLITSPRFLEYMNTALEKYAAEERVMQISGYMFPVEIQTTKEAFFLPVTTSWGWATWQRAWQHFDPAAQGYEALKHDRAKRKSFDLDGAYPYFRMLESQLRGEIDSWAIRWWLSVFSRNGLVLYPRQSLIENIGFDGSGTHGDNRGFVHFHAEHAQKISLPDEIAVSDPGYDAVVDFMRSNGSSTIRKWIRTILR